jgi:hypothetical protein
MRPVALPHIDQQLLKMIAAAQDQGLHQWRYVALNRNGVADFRERFTGSEPQPSAICAIASLIAFVRNSDEGSDGGKGGLEGRLTHLYRVAPRLRRIEEKAFIRGSHTPFIFLDLDKYQSKRRACAISALRSN